MNKFERLHLILNLIRTRPGIKTRELAEEAGVSQRSIYRYILTLASQYPIVSDKGYRLLPTAFLKTMNLTQEEYDTLRLALSNPVVLEIPNLRSQAKTLKGKIDTVVNSTLLKAGQPVCVFIPRSTLKARNKTFESVCSALLVAIRQNKMIDLVLNRDCGSDCLRVWPYQIINHLSDWHLVAYLSKRKVLEAFKLKDIEEVLPNSQTFVRDKTFDLASFFYSRWSMSHGEEVVAKVEFTGKAAKEILKEGPYGREQLTEVSKEKIFYIGIARSVDQFLKWVSSFGPEAQILAPQFLKEKMKERVMALSNIYCKQTKHSINNANLPEMKPAIKRRTGTAESQRST